MLLSLFFLFSFLYLISLLQYQDDPYGSADYRVIIIRENIILSLINLEVMIWSFKTKTDRWFGIENDTVTLPVLLNCMMLLLLRKPLLHFDKDSGGNFAEHLHWLNPNFLVDFFERKAPKLNLATNQGGANHRVNVVEYHCDTKWSIMFMYELWKINSLTVFQYWCTHIFLFFVCLKWQLFFARFI